MSSKHSHKDSISRKDIDTYLSSKDEKVKYSIEKEALSNDFDTDALEGWSSMNVTTTSLKQLDKKFIGKNYTGAIMILSSLVVITGSILIYFQFSSSAEIEEQYPITLSVEESDIIIPQTIDTLIEVHSSIVIQPKTIQKDFKKAKELEEKNVESNVTPQSKEVQLSDLPLLKVDIPSEVVSIKKINAKEVYYSDLKLIDFRKYRTADKIPVKTMVLTGLPANLESEESKTDEYEWKEIEISYDDYIKKSQSIFSNANYKKALLRYMTILDKYPTDDNALFYSGLCYYNLGQFQDAIDAFYKCLESQYSNFDEESEWFLAKSYAASGQTAKAKSIYEMIAVNGQFYSSQAKEVIKNLK